MDSAFATSTSSGGQIRIKTDALVEKGCGELSIRSRREAGIVSFPMMYSRAFQALGARTL